MMVFLKHADLGTVALALWLSSQFCCGDSVTHYSDKKSLGAFFFYKFSPNPLIGRINACCCPMLLFN